jgi:hypothetical protein
MKRSSNIALAALCAVCALLVACSKEETATAIRVIVDSDLQLGSELTKLEVRVFDPKGEEEWRRQDFALGKAKGPAQFSLPMSFRLAAENQSSTNDFLLVVTGIGPLGEGGSEIEVVEQQALASFRPGETLRLDMFLAKSCLLELCRQDGERSELSCDVQTGSCQEVPRREDLPVAKGDGIEAYEEAKADGGAAGDLDASEPSVDAGEPQPGVAVLNAGCNVSGSKACGGHNSTDALLCTEGKWTLRTVCDGTQRCDTGEGANQGTCQDIPAPCLDKQPGETVCEGVEQLTCGQDLLDYTRQRCEENQHCIGGTVVSCACDDGFESDGAGGCRDVDDCVANACQHGAKCVDGLGGYTCDCVDTGYEGERCEKDIDECAQINACSPDYPCIQTQPPGYVCRGEMADWPIPDSTPGSKAIQNYSFSHDDAVVTDVTTRLMWQRDLPAIYAGCTGQVFGEPGVLGASCTWEEALDYCSALILAGHSDWRLPSKIELESLLDTTIDNSNVPQFEARTPMVMPGVFTGVRDDGYWTSSRDVSSVDAHWSVSFSAPLSNPWDENGRVLCVRDTAVRGSGTPSTRYVVSLDETVLDRRTGLTWQQRVHAERPFSAAKALCENLRSLTNTPFRLPTLKELLSLIDPVRTSPAVDVAVFPDTPNALFWAGNNPTYSSRGADYYGLAVDFSSGRSTHNTATAGAFVRCVLAD